MPLKIQFASDLHLEFPANKLFLKSNPLQPVADVLVLAGDIIPFAVLNKHADFLNYLSDHFKVTYWLPGNHEYYHFDLADKSGVLNENIRSNVFLVNNTSTILENARLIFSTLWSKISIENQFHIEQFLNDFHLIKYKGKRFSANFYNKLHEESLVYIKEELAKCKDEKIAVFTHHCPTFMNYPEQYKGDVLNEAFAVELFDMIAESNINYWVYGHHHTNTPEFTIDKTKLLTNQLGYVQANEHRMFSNRVCFDF